MKTLNYLSEHRNWAFVIFVVIVGRILLSSYLPLMEFSEARYAEIARKIIARGDWVTLWFNDGQPFWGKPPLAFWSIAVSYLAFGINEFAARFSPLIYTLLTALLLARSARLNIGRRQSYLASILFLTSWGVLQTSGAVITDPLLTFSTTLVMVSFWEVVAHDKHRWAYLVWLGLAIGLLAKGPVALVICGGACGMWVIIYNQWKDFFRNIHLISGIALMLIIAVPWYYLAEQKTPGFLDYFIIGEHFDRYTQSKWAGDPYGSVKDRPFGTIWVYLLVAAFPWSFIAAARLFSKSVRHKIAENYRTDPLFYGYLALWLCIPLVFFTPAKNVLVTYTLPALPALCLLLAKNSEHLLLTKKHLCNLALASTLVFFIGSLIIYESAYKDHRFNQKPMVEKYLQLNAIDPGDLVYTGKRIFSPQFYTNGKVFFENDKDKYPKHSGTFYFATRERWLKSYQRIFAGRCTIEMQRVDFTLFYCPAVSTNKPGS